MAVGIILLSAVDPLAGYAAERTIDIKHLGEGQSIVRVDARAKYLLLPVEESSPESKLYMIVDNDVVRTFNVRLAVNKVDYFVPVDLLQLPACPGIGSLLERDEAIRSV